MNALTTYATLQCNMKTLEPKEYARLSSLLALKEGPVSLALWLPAKLPEAEISTLIHYLNQHRSDNIERIQIHRYTTPPNLISDPSQRIIVLPNHKQFPQAQSLANLLETCDDAAAVTRWFQRHQGASIKAKPHAKPGMRAFLNRLLEMSERYVDTRRTLYWWLYSMAFLLCGALEHLFPGGGDMRWPVWVITTPGFILLAVTLARFILTLYVQVYRTIHPAKGTKS